MMEEACKLKFRPHLASSGLALGLFVLARCLHRSIAKAEGDFVGLTPEKLYSKAHRFDKEIVAELQKLVTHGKL